MGEDDEQMQTQDQIAALNRALALQNRSAPTEEVAPLSHVADPQAAVRWLIDTEGRRAYGSPVLCTSRPN